jgi:hypothetical protein
VDTLHHDTLLLGQDFDHIAAFAFVFGAAADDFNRIAFSDFYFHVTRSSSC